MDGPSASSTGSRKGRCEIYYFLTQQIQRKFIGELRNYWSYHPKYKDIVEHIQGKYSDKFLTGLKRHRPAILTADGSVTIADCKKRSQWEVLTRYGRGQSIVYTVNGWLHSEGLWQPNVEVPVVDSYMGIDKDLLITDVQLIMSDKGQLSELRVMPREGFDLIELPEPVSDDEPTSKWVHI